MRYTQYTVKLYICYYTCDETGSNMGWVADPTLLNPPLLFKSILNTKPSKRLKKMLTSRNVNPPRIFYIPAK